MFILITICAGFNGRNSRVCDCGVVVGGGRPAERVFSRATKKKKLGRGWWNSVGVIYNDTHAYLLQIDVFFFGI